MPKERGRVEFGARFVFAALYLTVACSSAQNKPEKLDNIAITERGAEPGGEFCKDFDMTPAQVSAFFGRAKPVDARALHDRFDHLPCYIRGTAVWQNQPATWEIRAGGTGTVIVKTGAALLYGCSRCSDLFGQEKR
jgi:hypothetical protein